MAQRDSGFFKHRADANCELLFAIVAAPQIPLVSTACLGVHHLINLARFTVRAMRFALPDLTLEKFNRRRFITAGQRQFADDFRLRRVCFFVYLHATTLNLAQGFVNCKTHNCSCLFYWFSSVYEVLNSCISNRGFGTVFPPVFVRRK